MQATDKVGYRIRINRPWGQFADLNDKKQINSLSKLVPAKKKGQLAENDHDRHGELPTIVRFECHLVTQTIALMEYTKELESLLTGFKSGWILAKHLPDLGIPPHLEANLADTRRYRMPFETYPDTRFSLGLPMPMPKISGPAAHVILKRAICGLLRIKNIEYLPDNLLETLTNSVKEFYFGLLDRTNQQILLKRKELNKTFDLKSVEKAYHEMTHVSMVQLHNYYQSEIIAPNRRAIADFKRVHKEYRDVVDFAVHGKTKNEIEEVKEEEPDYEYFNELDIVQHSLPSPTHSIHSNSTTMSISNFSNNSVGFIHMDQMLHESQKDGVSDDDDLSRNYFP